jgi:steroid 5-alpha reductase family enzyme
MSADFAPGLVNNLIFTACISFGVQFILWLIHMKTRDATLADWWWGLGYATIALFTYFNTMGVGVESRKLLITLLTVAWGVRLSAHLIIRSYRDKWRELDRYENYRKAASKNVGWVMYRKVFGIQGLMMWIVSLPVQVTQFYLVPTEIGTIAMIGTALWLFGFLLEWGTDWQLANFKADPANRERVLNWGWWRYTRHPNYFGEACAWWGIYLVACDNLAGWWVIVSPLRMHYRMAYRMGLVWLEEKMTNNKPGYADYVARTNRFYPWFPRPETQPKVPTDAAPQAARDSAR